jgi:hypothetical protein
MQRLSQYGQYSSIEALLLSLRQDQDKEEQLQPTNAQLSEPSISSSLLGRLSMRRHSDPVSSVRTKLVFPCKP